MSAQIIPVVDTNFFRRDVYLLHSMLCGGGNVKSKAIAGTNLGKGAVDAFESEVRRQLLLVAVSARNIMEDLEFEGCMCGERLKPVAKAGEMDLEQVCSSIVHASEVNLLTEGDVYGGIIETQGNWNDEDAQVKVNTKGFLECCINLQEYRTASQGKALKGSRSTQASAAG